MATVPPELTFKPVTPDQWEDLVALFGPSGAYSGCWCMWWRTTRAEFERNKNAGNKAAMRRLIEGGQVPGILAYREGRPVGWCSIGPRADYGSLNRSPVLKPIDDRPVWSIVCFFVDKQHHGQGMQEQLIHGAIAYAAEHGARIVEAYPTRPRGKRLPPVSSYMGIPKVLERAGFQPVAQPSEAKLIMRYTIAEAADSN